MYSILEELDKKTKGKPRPDPDEKPRVVRGPADLQRLRLEKLMKNPEKPVIIPERPKGKNMPSAPDFVRNVMGSSAGAGSGEFHVYRHLRRKEYSRQKFIQEKGEKEILDDTYHQKLEDNKEKQAKITAKKRAKRLKRKQASKNKGKKPKTEKPESDDEESSENESIDEDTETYEVKVIQNTNKDEIKIKEKPLNDEVKIIERPENDEVKITEEPKNDAAKIIEEPKNDEVEIVEKSQTGEETDKKVSEVEKNKSESDDDNDGKK